MDLKTYRKLIDSVQDFAANERENCDPEAIPAWIVIQDALASLRTNHALQKEISSQYEEEDTRDAVDFIARA